MSLRNGSWYTCDLREDGYLPSVGGSPFNSGPPSRRKLGGSAFVSNGRWYPCALREDGTQVC